MADDADRAAELDERLAGHRAPAAAPVTLFICRRRFDQPENPRKVVLAAYVDRWTAIGWSIAGAPEGGKVAIEWRGKGEPQTPQRPGR